MAEDPLASTSTSTQSAGGDWPAQVTDSIVRLIEQVKSKTTQPVVKAVRGVVYGLIAAMLGLVIAVLALIGVFRAADRLRNLIIEDSVWITYLALGVLFTLAGSVVFAMRKPRS